MSYLAHHGIKGQRWGVRRYQNEDGSLTEAGKSRYIKNHCDIKYIGEDYTTSSYRALGYKDLSQKTTEQVDRLHHKANDLINQYDEKWNEAIDTGNKIGRSQDAINEGVNELKKMFVSKDEVDDPELVELECFDVAYDIIRQGINKQTTIGEYENQLDEWFDDCRKTVDSIVGDMGDTIVAKKGEQKSTYKDVVEHTLLSSTSPFLSYAARHGVIDEALGVSEKFDGDDYLARRLYEEFMK